MEGDGDLIDVALGVDADVVNELLVLGDAVRRRELLVRESADGLEIELDHPIGFREQASGLRRGLGAQEDGEGQQNQDCGDDEERSSGASGHSVAVRSRQH
jgi:hypothetical protein